MRFAEKDVLGKLTLVFMRNDENWDKKYSYDSYCV
jgi:hypothetical protein